jgi:hypothetical protein
MGIDPPEWDPVWSSQPPPYRKLAHKSMWFREQLELGVDWPEDRCVAWPWRDGDRRHTMNFLGNAVPVTHVVLHFTAGPRPSKKHQGLHSCDVQWCINPKHLRWGLEIENRMDQVTRHRGDIGRIGLDKARAVRKELEEISERHGVPLDAIARIAGGKTWAEDKWT